MSICFLLKKSIFLADVRKMGDVIYDIHIPVEPKTSNAPKPRICFFGKNDSAEHEFFLCIRKFKILPGLVY